MKMRDALREMKKIAGDNAEVSAHYGRTKRDRAVQVWCCHPEVAKYICGEFIRKFGGSPTYVAGFVCVWLP
jgi:hypothetical protein